MATVTGFTSDRMLAIENTTVVSGTVVGDNLVLTTRDNTQINAGNVRGPQGSQGPIGEVSLVQLNAVSAAVTAAHAPGAITTVQLADGAITTPKILDAAVTTAKLATQSVTSDKLGAGVVTGAKIADLTITLGKLASSSVDSGKIVDGTIVGGDIANATITEAKLSDSLALEIGAAGLNGWGGTLYYWKVGNIVFFNYNTAGPSAASQVIFIFPVGFRPSRRIYNSAEGSSADTVWVESNGELRTTTGQSFLYTRGFWIAA